MIASHTLQPPSTPFPIHAQLTEDGLATVNSMLNKELAAGAEEDANFPISKACQISVDAVTLAKMTTGA